MKTKRFLRKIYYTPKDQRAVAAACLENAIGDAIGNVLLARISDYSQVYIGLAAGAL